MNQSTEPNLSIVSSPTQTPVPAQDLAQLPEALSRIGLKLRAPCLSDATLIRKINSPLMKGLGAMGGPGGPSEEIAYTLEEVCELLYVFTRGPSEARAALRGGRDAFGEKAMALLDLVPLHDMVPLDEILKPIFKNIALDLQRAKPAPGVENLATTE